MSNVLHAAGLFAVLILGTFIQMLSNRIERAARSALNQKDAGHE